ncbi:solute carrier family 13 member 2 isoform X2 [Rhipicephalus sanguineus]|uniref:solute carrier family 13 member 2 isoform X2 n=1 Tax=Rhipicephalus sanguineus TaxID=34632 RepID=UPI0020C47C8A|nr:solute carrier family 13 member 2 isoform X2 [Rhipicephalus sanguineus]
MVTRIFYVEKPPNSDGTSYNDESCGAKSGRKMLAALGALRESWRFVYLICVPLLLLPVALCIGGKAGWCAYILLWMAFYWSVEACPLAATSLMPVFLFPPLGILSSSGVASFYLNDIGILLLCSLIMAGAVETSNLHKRIALRSLLAIGTSNVRLLLGFMLVTMALSMWIPNTASASIMAPIAMAVVDQMHASSKSHHRDVESSELESTTRRQEPVYKENEEARRKNSSTTADSEDSFRQKVVRTTMLLSVAYSANIGGTGSLTGTGSNLVLKGLMDDRFPECSELTFATWMLYNVPTMLICVFIGWIYLQFSARKAMRGPSSGAAEEKVREEISRRYRDLGPMSFSEWCVTLLMTAMILLWFTMKPQVFPGWVEMIPNGKLIRSSTPAMLVTFLLFLIPKNPRKPGGRAIITWREASERAQWGIVILIGGAMCLAEGCKQSGLSAMLVHYLKGLDVLPHGLTVLVLCFITSALTEVTTNMAVSSILLPVVLEMAIAIGVHPLYLAMPVTICCSFSFMLPAGAPPNAIVYEVAKLTIPEMAKLGYVMNMVCVLVEVAMIHAIGFPIFGLTTLPDWARPSVSTVSATAVPNTTDVITSQYGSIDYI